jgi:hypothetical protein
VSWLSGTGGYEAGGRRKSGVGTSGAGGKTSELESKGLLTGYDDSWPLAG